MKPLFISISLLFFLKTFAGSDTIEVKHPRPKLFFKLSYDLLQIRNNLLNAWSIPKGTFVNTGKNAHFLNFPVSVGFYDQKERNFHEFSVSRLYYSNNPSFGVLYNSPNIPIETKSIGITLTASFGMRYEFNLKMGNEKNKKSNFYIGFPIECYYVHQKFSPFYSSLYKYATNGFGFAVGITPRYQYWFSKNIYLDIALPLTAYDGLVIKTTTNNANFPSDQRQSVRYLSYSGTPVINFRIGIGFKI